MTDRLRLWVLVACGYVLAQLAARVIVVGVWSINRELLTHMLIVPVLQIAVLELARRASRNRFWS